MKFWVLFFLGMVASQGGQSGAIAFAAPHIADDGQACRSCHAKYFEAIAVPHLASSSGKCGACHVADPKHLQGSAPQAVQTLKSPDSCKQCHKAQEKAHLHPALNVDNNCTQCHNPHGSQIVKILKDPLPKLCTKCHDHGQTDGAVVHSPVTTFGQSCLNCHDAHSSDFPKMLLAPQMDLCLSCHNKPVEAADGGRPLANIAKSVSAGKPHGALLAGGCLACHRPHSGPNRRILKKPFPVEIYSRYNPGNATTPNTYALCFQCHDVAMLNKDIGKSGTAFRQDTVEAGKVVRRNLHWLHVTGLGATTNGRFGKSCKTCHDSHGSEQLHLIRETVGVTSQAKLVYQVTEQGGRCMISCHADKSYRRLP